MVWGAIAMAGLSLVQGVVSGSQQRSAADAQNKAQKQMIKDRYKRDQKEWKLNKAQGWSDYAWALANTEAQRYQDRVRQEDYEARQEQVIDAAIANLELNTEALRDQYITAERLRARQVTYELRDSLAQERISLSGTMSDLNTRAAESMLKTRNDMASYLNSIKRQVLDANALVSSKEGQGKNIQEQIVISEQLDTLQRDAQYVTALAEGADVRAGVTARQGGSNSSRAVALDSMKAFGRSYNQLKLEQQKGRSQLNSYNASLSGETASQLAKLATAMDSEVQAMRYSRNTNRLTLADLSQDARIAKAGYNLSTSSLRRNFQQLTVPGFALAERQGEREYQSLVRNTIGQIKGASTPYREAIIFDPLEPIAGLKPEKAAFTPVAKPGWGSILMQAGVGAAQGAMSMSYTKADGSLGFR
jgi:hypothetical protein